MESRHCQEIAENPHVAGNIVTQHLLGQKTRCVSFEGLAEQLEDTDETHPGLRRVSIKVRNLYKSPKTKV